MKNNNINTIKVVFIDTLPVLAGYLVLGIGFGILLASKGYTVTWAFFMSLFIYAGAMQYLTVDMFNTNISLITVAITTLMVNARHIFYGLSMLEKYKNVGTKKLYMIFALTDETYSMLCSKPPEANINTRNYYFFVSLFNHIYWIIGSMLGALLGTMLSFNFKGVEFALTALFTTIFVEQWLTCPSRIPATLGVFLSILCLLLFGSSSFLIPAMILIVISMLLLYKYDKGAQS